MFGRPRLFIRSFISGFEHSNVVSHDTLRFKGTVLTTPRPLRTQLNTAHREQSYILGTGASSFHCIGVRRNRRSSYDAICRGWERAEGRRGSKRGYSGIIGKCFSILTYSCECSQCSCALLFPSYRQTFGIFSLKYHHISRAS